MHFKGYQPLEVPQMDKVHAEFVTLLDKLIASDNSRFVENFEIAIAHTKVHFAQEEEWLEFYHVGSKREHLSEHAQILGEMDYFLKKAKTRKLPFARAYVKERLPSWLYQHTVTMDADLAKSMRD